MCVKVECREGDDTVFASSDEGEAMATDSKYMRYRDQGEQPNVNNVERFGEPAHSLFISTKFLSITQNTEITDKDGNVVYRSKSRAISLHDKTDITNAQGKQVAHIERKVLTLRHVHRVTMADGSEFEISHELMHLVKDVANIKGLNWTMRGNIFQLNFEVYDENDNVVAVIGQKLISIKDKYAVDIYRPEYEPEIVAILIALQHTVRDEEATSTIASYSS